ncbi:MAG: hypothetical protein ACRENX_02535 [Candidatus Dormibacteria bacterium]
MQDGSVWDQRCLAALASLLKQEGPGLEEQGAEGLVRMAQVPLDAATGDRPTARLPRRGTHPSATPALGGRWTTLR